MTPAVSVPVAPLSIWHPIHLGTDETGRRVETTWPSARNRPLTWWAILGSNQ